MKDKCEIGTPLVDTDAVYAKAVYEQYCSVTNWPIPDKIVAFSVITRRKRFHLVSFGRRIAFGTICVMAPK